MSNISEHDVGLPGVDIAIKPVRSYVYGALAANLLGYVGPPDDTNKEEAGKFTFYQSDVDGKSNIEKIFDQYLRGRPGVRYLRRNAKGVIDGVLREDPPMQGANVYLTIDARIQAIAEEAIRSVARGAAVVVDPNNGDVLAMGSVWARRAAFISRASNPESCPGQSGWRFIIHGNAGRRPTPPTFRLARVMCWPRRCKWRWPTPLSPMAEFPTIHVSLVKS